MATRVDERNITLDLSWHNIRRQVLRDILSDKMIPVPSLVAASHFGLFSVFVKKKVNFASLLSYYSNIILKHAALEMPNYNSPFNVIVFSRRSASFKSLSNFGLRVVLYTLRPVVVYIVLAFYF